MFSAHNSLPKEITTHILKYLNSNELLVNIPQLNKTWKETLNTEQYLVKEISGSRLIHDMVNNKTSNNRVLTLLEGGWTNRTFHMKKNNDEYIVRVAGIKSDVLVDRKSEAYNAKIASDKGINPRILFFSIDQGTQVSEYVKNPVTLSPEDCKLKENIKKVATAFKVIHQSTNHFSNEVDLFQRIREMITLLEKHSIPLPKEHSNFLKKMQEIEDACNKIHIDRVSCHMDATPYNFMYSKNHPNTFTLIDWEYSGQSDLVWDLSYFAISAELDSDQEKYLLQTYFGTENLDPLVLYRFVLYKPMIHHWMSLWTTIQIMNENFKGGYENLLKYEKLRLKDCESAYKSEEFNHALQSLKECCQSATLKPTM